MCGDCKKNFQNLSLKREETIKNRKFPENQISFKEPTYADLIFNFSKAIINWTLAGFSVVSKDLFSNRLAICQKCKFWQPEKRNGLGKCNHKNCGCTIAKLWIKTEKCPIGNWEENLNN